MGIRLVELITSEDAKLRDICLALAVAGLDDAALASEMEALEDFRSRADSLYHRVRALLFLFALHRYHLPGRCPAGGRIPFAGHVHLLNRRFEEAIQVFRQAARRDGWNDALCSALSAGYRQLAFQTLADQVRRSVRAVRGNQWMFRLGHPLDQPLRLRRELLRPDPGTGLFPLLQEHTPVRMDLTHSAWSDIFFLGMDYPEGARVLNVSIDLGVHGRDKSPRPPVEASLRVIDRPVLRLVSVDLGATAEITSLEEVFDFARDYLGLLKAAVIASGLVPPGIEGSHHQLEDLLQRLAGPGRGLEIVSHVNNIPKGSRLAVSTNLLAGLIAVCMRATGQTASLTGPLAETERRIVLARAILGEWLGGSGGGWQDSGGVWPGIKLIEGVAAGDTDPEFGVSRGRLLPRHRILGGQDLAPDLHEKLSRSLVLVHGGMAQNVGPILEMVTEKYLLRSAREWAGRRQALGVLDEVLSALKAGDMAALGAATTRNFEGPLQTIIPWATNHYTETLIERAGKALGDDFLGFWMLGGMSGGGMGFITEPARHAEAQERLLEIMGRTKAEMENALPFAMDPVVYDFAINENGSSAVLLTGEAALLSRDYYAREVPRWLRMDPRDLSPIRRRELQLFGTACRNRPELQGMVETLFDQLFPQDENPDGNGLGLQELLRSNGFDPDQHEQIRADLKSGRIGLAQNALPANAEFEDVRPGDVVDAATDTPPTWQEAGLGALARGEAAVVTLAGGVGSRWTQGAGVVKALHPFCRLGGRHRTFIEVHLAKSRRIGIQAGCSVPHVFTTSYLTHDPIRSWLERESNYGHPGPVKLSPGRAVGLRMVPMVRDLRFAWEQMPQQQLDEQAQKVRQSLRSALLAWAQAAGEGGDYTDNLSLQCLHPVGHWYEIPNLLRNGVLNQLLQERPALKHLMLHNVDTLGADLDPALLGAHLEQGGALSFEVISRRLEDLGGGLARVDGKVRLVEGLALPREEIEFDLSYYNTLTCWIDIDRLLALFQLTRDDLEDTARVTAAIRRLAGRLPTYVTLKEVKKRWGHGQEDVFPVAQFEKLWGDMSALSEADCRFLAVPRLRGQQLKDPAQLDGWFRDGSAEYVESLCEFG